jgi:hypothetical protein
MARKRIDWEALEPALRRLKKEELLQVLHHAYRELPASRVVLLFGEYVDLTTLHSPPLPRNDAAPRRLFKAVQKFYADSLAGQYYESFRVNSRNFMDKSEGTELWISECNQFFDKCIELSGKGHHVEARKAMDLLFELLHQIDSGSDDIIFFADEGGSWQVGVNEEKVLPAYFRSLAAVAEPDEYAARVLEVIEERGSHNREKLLKVARRGANEAQRQALKMSPRKQ